jgi:hypothetical protein
MVSEARKLASKKWRKSDSPAAIAYRARLVEKRKNSPTQKIARQAGKRRRVERDREAVLAHYGPRCIHCGIEDPLVLTIDHENQDGKNHVNSNGTRYMADKLRRWLVVNKFPPGFRILCFNCNVRAYRLKHTSARDRAVV